MKLDWRSLLLPMTMNLMGMLLRIGEQKDLNFPICPSVTCEKSMK